MKTNGKYCDHVYQMRITLIIKNIVGHTNNKNIGDSNVGEY